MLSEAPPQRQPLEQQRRRPEQEVPGNLINPVLELHDMFGFGHGNGRTGIKFRRKRVLDMGVDNLKGEFASDKANYREQQPAAQAYTEQPPNQLRLQEGE